MRDERDLRYSKTHEWVDMSDDNTAYIGIDDFAQSEMGDIVFINLPDVGDTVEEDDALLEVKAEKMDAEVESLYDGKIVEIIAKEGEVYPVGAVLGYIEAEDE